VDYRTRLIVPVREINMKKAVDGIEQVVYTVFVGWGEP
jgi:hypothetical protein